MRDLWLRRGCPERMTVHIVRTGETLILSDGSHVPDRAQRNPLFMRVPEVEKHPAMVRWPVTDKRRCEACQREFLGIREDARYCSLMCRKKAARKRAEQRRRIEAERMISACGLGRGAGL